MQWEDRGRRSAGIRLLNVRIIVAVGNSVSTLGFLGLEGLWSRVEILCGGHALHCLVGVVYPPEDGQHRSSFILVAMVDRIRLGHLSAASHDFGAPPAIDAIEFHISFLHSKNLSNTESGYQVWMLRQE